MMGKRFAITIGLALGAMLLAGCEPPTAESTQNGFRGTGMLQLEQPKVREAKVAANQAPAASPALPSTPPYAKDVYQNVQVLGDLGVGQFTRLMAAMTQWVAPEEGCNYCHVTGNLASDDIYTKVVSRRMLQMTQHINASWTDHVGETGVTCYTCHRGNNVPAEIWFEDPGPKSAAKAGWRDNQNTPADVAAMASLPYDSLSRYLLGDEEIRVIGNTALPSTNTSSIKATEGTYSLMMHMSDALGVNCTFCHNTRAMADWTQSTPQRVTAWYGIEMARSLNQGYLDPLQPVYPEHRLGSLGDAPKANCATCHQGVNKPLYGAAMVKDFPSLTREASAAAMGQATSETAEAVASSEDVDRSEAEGI